MKNKTEVSPIEKDTWKRINEDPEFAMEFFDDLSERPISVQFAILRRFNGLSQEKIAAKLHRKQNYISKLEKPGVDHLLSHYEKAVKLIHGRIAIIPEGMKITPSNEGGFKHAA